MNNQIVIKNYKRFLFFILTSNTGFSNRDGYIVIKIDDINIILFHNDMSRTFF